MRRKLLKLGTEGVWLLAASETTSAQDFSHSIHNRTIDEKYSTAVERPTTPGTNGPGQLFPEGLAGTEDQMASNTGMARARKRNRSNDLD